MSDQFNSGYALLIGVNENQAPQWALPGVAKDIAALAAVLIHPERFAYPTTQVKAITGTEVTRLGILDGLAWLQDQLSANTSNNNTTAIIYYSGHGLYYGTNYYLVPYDFVERQIELRALRAEDFAREVHVLAPRRLLVILDCCLAGGMRVKGMKLPEEYTSAAIPLALLMQEQKGDVGSKGLTTLARGYGRAVLSSSTDGQSSYMRADGAMSLFTYHLIEALTGHAQPQEGATEVLVSDVMGYVTRKVPESACRMGVIQPPIFRSAATFL